MFPLAVILGIAAFGNDRRGAIYGLPLAVGGTTLAGYHTALVAGWVPKGWIPCGAGPSCSDQKLVILGDIQIQGLSRTWLGPRCRRCWNRTSPTSTHCG